jgi:anti-sigma factor RsiW
MSEFFHRLRFRRDHRWAPGQMSAYLDAQLGAGSRGRMERHTNECAECRALLAGLRRMLDALQRLPPPDGGVDVLQMAASVRARLRVPPTS